MGTRILSALVRIFWAHVRVMMKPAVPEWRKVLGEHSVIFQDQVGPIFRLCQFLKQGQMGQSTGHVTQPKMSQRSLVAEPGS